MSRKRQYDSPAREARAEQTRSRIRVGARAAFGRKGFVHTTIGDIAKEAGVSAPTIYAVYGSKAGVVSAMLEEMERTVKIGERLAAVFGEPDASRQMSLFVAAHCALFAAGTDILRAAVEARGAPEVAALIERGDAHRRRVIDGLVAGWGETGVLRTDLRAREAAERMWLLTSVESYLSAVDRLGWSPEKYEGWLNELLRVEILGKGEP